MATEKYISGALTLVSDDAIKLYEMLAADGNVMEYMSSLFESSAQGLVQAELLGISEKLNVLPDLVSKIDDLSKVVNNISTAGGVVNYATPPSTFVQGEAPKITESSGKEQQATTPEQPEITPKPQKKPTTPLRMGAIMDNMKKMRGPGG